MAENVKTEPQPDVKAEREKVEAEARRAREEKEAAERALAAEKERAAKEQREREAAAARARAEEAAAPDKEKLHRLAQALRLMPIPEMTTERGGAIAGKARDRLRALADQVEEAAKSIAETLEAEE